MKVKKIMEPEVATCSADAPVTDAAKIMWEHDCGFVPILDEDKLVGVLTDRDISMAALMTGLPLGLIRVREVMNTELATCDAEDEVTTAHATMRDTQIRRLPVVNGENDLVGVLSINDLINEAYASRSKAAVKRQRDTARTLAAISERRVVEDEEEE